MHQLPKRPSAGQLLAGLKIVRTRLAEQGYLIAPVAQEHRRHESDFVVLRKDEPREFAIVRKAATCIVIRAFQETRGNFYRVLPGIRKASPVPIRRGAPLLNKSRAGDHPWLHYVSDEVHGELVALGCVVNW